MAMAKSLLPWCIYQRTSVPLTAILLTLAVWTPFPAVVAKPISLTEIDNWRIYPVRSQEEAAVIEWGHSAIISALDAAVAHFGPQTTQAALLEVETKPILAEPLDGTWKDQEEWVKNQTADGKSAQVRLLDNADAIHGNVAVMTDVALTRHNNDTNPNDVHHGLTGLDLAIMAQASGAAALLIVHIDETRPDDMYRLAIPAGREAEASKIDIPVAVISLASANVLTTATVTETSKQEDVINNGMPDRYVRTFVSRCTCLKRVCLERNVFVANTLLTEFACMPEAIAPSLKTWKQQNQLSI
jgi:hypothetical protein